MALRTRNGLFDAEIVYSTTGVAPRANTVVKLTHREAGYSQLALYYDGGLYTVEPNHPMDLVSFTLEVGKTYSSLHGYGTWQIVAEKDGIFLGLRLDAVDINTCTFKPDGVSVYGCVQLRIPE